MQLNDMIAKTGEFIAAQTALKSVPANQLRLEADLVRKLDNLFATAMNEIIQQVEATGAMSATTAMSKMAAVKPKMVDLVFANSKVATDQGTKRTINELKKAGMAIEVPALSKQTELFLQDRTFAASANTMRNLAGYIEGDLAKVAAQGLSNAEAAKLISKNFKDLRKFELNKIARTEIQRAQNAANNAALQGKVEYKQWWTADDADVRELHVDMHGQIVRVGEAFSNGLQYPGDAAGPPEEFINCRCRVVPFIMPSNKMAPPGVDFFTEDDLVDRPKVKPTAVVKPTGEAGPSPVTPPPKPLLPPQKYNAEQYIDNLPPAQAELAREAITDYTSEGMDAVMKAYQRGASEGEMLQIIKESVLGDPRKIYGSLGDEVAALDDLLANTKNFKGKTYRGMVVDEDVFDEFRAGLRKGATWEVDSFTSTSQDLDIAEGFMYPEVHQRRVLMHFKNKTGTDIRALSEHFDEDEVLLRKGRNFKVTSTKVLPPRRRTGEGLEVWLTEI
jgi:SPP1 gp7 family putative phage head morphogenesis protein